MGIFDRIVNSFKGASNKEFERFEPIILDIYDNQIKTNNYYWIYDLNIKSFQQFIETSSKAEKLEFTLYCIKEIHKHKEKADDKKRLLYRIRQSCINHLNKIEPIVSDTYFNTIIKAIYDVDTKNNISFKDWGLHFLVNALEKRQKKEKLGPIFIDTLKYLKDIDSYCYDNNDLIRFRNKIESIIFNENSDSEVKSVYFLGESEFTQKVNEIIKKLPETDKTHWFKLIAKAQKATGARPTKKYLADAELLINDLGKTAFKLKIEEIFELLTKTQKIISIDKVTKIEEIETYSLIERLSILDTEALKGLIWMYTLVQDEQTSTKLADLAIRCFKKIPDVGAASVGVGNACLYGLANLNGLEGIGQLSRLKLIVKQNSTLKVIESYLLEAAKNLNVSMHEIEDIAVNTFQLHNGYREWQIDTFTASIKITGIGKSELKWFKADGKEQKTIPSSIKENYKDELTKITQTQKQINQTTTSQRDRLDRMFRSNREMSLTYFKEKYLNHGLLSYVIANLIFKFSNENIIELAIKSNQGWVNEEGEVINIELFNSVTLWHPATSTVAQVKKWREFLLNNEISQPFKQAYREVYLLTEAEINTRTYSNRMASHILKQHQFVMLAKTRNWNAKLEGAFDGDFEYAHLALPEYDLRAEFWTDAVRSEEEMTEMGIYRYVTTDQIRFINTTTKEVVELIDVPVIPFSETLRDVDLFVGVASVGNDPNWMDSGGVQRFNEYWEAYSFGDLSEVAKTRKEILTSLIPKLKIANVTSIRDKFVVVKGKLRTYKIHMGSTNILMEPNDQYLCIVPDRSIDSKSKDIFLPFEGDRGLSIIISKAILLANDDKITDTTITSQINYR